MTIHAAKYISITIERSFADVYNFIAIPENMPKWAAGLSKGHLHKSGEDWLADSPMGEIKIHFTPSNDFGIADHYVTLPSGEINYNPLRVIKNGTGSDVVFTLFKMPGVTDTDFDKDAKMVEKDLNTLKTILES